MEPMHVYVLHVQPLQRLENAFAMIMDAPDVASCMIEPDHSEIRFLSSAEAAKALIERIYLDGGLVWSSRHHMTTDPPRV